MSDIHVSEKPAQSEYTFYPRHMFVESMAALVVVAVLVVLALVWQIPLDEKANPADTTYVPRPEWYFLFYFQLLKYFEGALTIVGIFVLPMIIFAALFLLPFIDRKKTTSLKKRPGAILAASAAVVLVVGMTALSMVEDAANPKILKRLELPPIAAEDIEEGERLFSNFCVLCHAMDGKGGFMATDLTQIGGRASRTYIEHVVMNPQIVSDKTIMSLIPLSDEERHKVSAYLSRKK